MTKRFFYSFTLLYRVTGWYLFFGLLSLTDVYGQLDTLSFLHITDTHLLFHADHFPPGSIPQINHKSKSVKQFIHFIQTAPVATDSKMVVITGDMIDFYETGDRKNDMFSLQIQQYANIPEISQIPVFCALGNHDIVTLAKNETKWVYQLTGHPGWNFSQNNAGKARAEWIRNVPCFAYGTWYSLVYKVGQTGYRFIFLDNAYNCEILPLCPFIGYEQQHWLRDILEQSPDEVKIICMHIPFSTEWTSDPTRNALYVLLSQYPSVKLVLAGDTHKNVINKFDGTGFIQVETAAFVSDAANWRLVKLTADKIIVSSTGTKQEELIIPVR